LSKDNSLESAMKAAITIGLKVSAAAKDSPGQTTNPAAYIRLDKSQPRNLLRSRHFLSPVSSFFLFSKMTFVPCELIHTQLGHL